MTPQKGELKKQDKPRHRADRCFVIRPARIYHTSYIIHPSSITRHDESSRSERRHAYFLGGEKFLPGPTLCRRYVCFLGRVRKERRRDGIRAGTHVHLCICASVRLCVDPSVRLCVCAVD